MYQRYNGDCENNRILLKCKNEGGTTLLGVLDGEIEATADIIDIINDFLNLDAAFQVASISVNTKDFSRPCTKIEFTCNIAIITDLIIPEIAYAIRFQIFRLCNNQLVPISIGPEWLFSGILEIGGRSDTFSFFVCDCDCSCKNECCNYIVAATITPEDFVTQFTGQIIINNVTLSAVIVDNS